MNGAEIYCEPIDKECAGLCDFLNSLSGIKTIESCCGHGKEPYRIWFIPESLDCLPNLLSNFSDFGDWRIEIYVADSGQPVRWIIEGPIGKKAYEQSIDIASPVP